MSRRPGYIIGDHWLEVAFGRICAGDQEQAVMGDYGWVQMTDAEREAVERGYCALMGVEDMSAECTRWDAEAAATLRGLLERLK